MTTPALLATRCPACTTVFRVVPDQLRVSDGWVRCGRCDEVFNAAQALIDVGAAVSAAAAPDDIAVGSAATPTGRDPDPLDPDRRDPDRRDDDGPDTVPGEAGEDDPFGAAPARPTPAAPAAARDGPWRAARVATASPLSAAANPRRPRDDDAPFSPPSPRVAAPAASPGLVAPHDATLDPSPGRGVPPPGDAPRPPSFVRRADRAQRWRRPAVRATLALLLVAGLLGLVGQTVYAYRDLVAARSPQMRALLAPACERLGCRIDPPRSIDSVAVDGASLRHVERSSLYQLQLVVRNGADFDVALPAVELALNDAGGRTQLRKVLTPAELGAAAPTVPAGGEVALQATLRAAPGVAFAGYTVELFYP